MHEKFDAKFDALQSEMREILRLQRSQYSDQVAEIHAVKSVKKQVNTNTSNTFYILGLFKFSSIVYTLEDRVFYMIL